MELEHLGGTYGGNRKPTHFLCLVLKLLQIQPEKEIIIEFIRNPDYRYVRVLGAFYFRLVAKPIDIYQYLEIYYNDYRGVKFRDREGFYQKTHVDELIDQLLNKDECCDVVLPRLPKRFTLGLEPRVSALEDDLSDEIQQVEEEPELRLDALRLKHREQKDEKPEEEEKKDLVTEWHRASDPTYRSARILQEEQWAYERRQAQIKKDRDAEWDARRKEQAADKNRGWKDAEKEVEEERRKERKDREPGERKERERDSRPDRGVDRERRRDDRDNRRHERSDPGRDRDDGERDRHRDRDSHRSREDREHHRDRREDDRQHRDKHRDRDRDRGDRQASDSKRQKKDDDPMSVDGMNKLREQIGLKPLK